MATFFLLHYIKTINDGLSKLNFKVHFGDNSTERCLVRIVKIINISVFGNILSKTRQSKYLEVDSSRLVVQQ